MKKPWLDSNEKPLSDEELKKVSKDWGQEIWEDYLSSIEKARHKRELLIDPKIYDQGGSEAREQKEHLEEYSKSLISELQEQQSPEYKLEVVEREELVHKALGKLTDKQKKVIDMIFWQSLSERQIARKMGVSQPTVHLIKERALKAIKRELVAYGLNF